MAPESKAAEAESQQTQTQTQQQSTDQKTEQKPAASLGEDDEFEDFPVDDWPADQTEAAQDNGETKHLWEESWDDDDMTDDFSAQLKKEIEKFNEARRR